MWGKRKKYERKKEREYREGRDMNYKRKERKEIKGKCHVTWRQ
jgi:hypothetical protein